MIGRVGDEGVERPDADLVNQAGRDRRVAALLSGARARVAPRGLPVQRRWPAVDSRSIARGKWLRMPPCLGMMSASSTPLVASPVSKRSTILARSLIVRLPAWLIIRRMSQAEIMKLKDEPENFRD